VQAMFVVPKKKFKKAHDRNKLKRRMREAYRLQKSSFYEQLKGSSVNLDLAFLYTGGEEQGYAEIKTSMLKILNFLTGEIVSKRK
jgi:ribonuclease P protein component